MKKNQNPQTQVCVDALSNEARINKIIGDRPEKIDPNATIDLFKSDQRAVDVYKKMGVDATNFTHEIKGADIRHAWRQHSGNYSPLRKNEIPLTREDLTLVPDIIKNADSIVPSSYPTRRGMPAAIYKKRYNGFTYYIEEGRVDSKKLGFKTMYKEKTQDLGERAMPEGSVAQTALSNESPSISNVNDNVPAEGSFVNPQPLSTPKTVEGIKPPLTTQTATEGLGTNVAGAGEGK